MNHLELILPVLGLFVVVYLIMQLQVVFVNMLNSGDTFSHPLRMLIRSLAMVFIGMGTSILCAIAFYLFYIIYHTLSYS
jgi:hypothetical protein